MAFQKERASCGNTGRLISFWSKYPFHPLLIRRLAKRTKREYIESMSFAELCNTSNFTFLTGGSHAEEYARQAFKFGMPALAISDTNSVAGIARAHVELREIARKQREDGGAAIVPRLLAAARLETMDGITVTALPRDRAAWGRLCRMLTLAKGRASKGDCLLHLDDVLEFGTDMELLLHTPWMPRGADAWRRQATQLTRRFGMAVSVVLSPKYNGKDPQRFDHLAGIADQLGVGTVASATPVMHRGSRRRLSDVLTCVREGLRIDDIGSKALSNAEQHMRSEAQMLQMFADHEAAVHRSGEIAASCTFSLDELKYEYPSEISVGEAPQDRLERLALAGLKWRYPEGLPEKVVKMVHHELALIGKLGYAPLFPDRQ